MGATDYEGSPSRVQGVSRKRRKEGDEEVHDVVRVAHCMVGAPRGLVPTNQKRAAATGLARNLRQHTLLGLAPEGSGVNLTLFALLHTNDQARDGARHSVFGQDAVSNVLEQLVGGLPHVKLGTLRFNNVTTCASPVAMRRMPCCRGKSPPKFGARGMLINLWPDECLSMVLDYEREHGVSFDWVTRSRPDLACFEPLPSLAALPQTHVYSTVKEDGQMWDTLFLIPRPLLDWFRWRSFGIAQTASKAHCANSARQKVPEWTMYYDLVLSSEAVLLDARQAASVLKVGRDDLTGVVGSGPVPFKRKPLLCALARTGVSGDDAKRSTLQECTRRLSAHQSCAQVPWPSKNHTACPVTTAGLEAAKLAKLKAQQQQAGSQAGSQASASQQAAGKLKAAAAMASSLEAAGRVCSSLVSAIGPWVVQDTHTGLGRISVGATEEDLPPLSSLVSKSTAARVRRRGKEKGS